MSRVKAIVCSVLLMIVMFTLLFATIFIKGVNDTSLYIFVVSAMAGMWIGEKVDDFYKWLRSK